MRARHHDLQRYCRFLAVSMVQSLPLRHGCRLRRGRCCRILGGILMRLRRRSPLGLAHEIAEASGQRYRGKPPGRLQNREKTVRRHRELSAIPGTRTLHCVRLTDCSSLPSQPARFSALMLDGIIALLMRKALASEAAEAANRSRAQCPERRAPLRLQIDSPLIEGIGDDSENQHRSRQYREHLHGRKRRWARGLDDEPFKSGEDVNQQWVFPESG